MTAEMGAAARDFRTSEAVAVLRAVHASRRDAAIRELRYAISTMTRRYGDSCADFVLAHVTKNTDIAERHSRAQARRLAAVQRLTLALANLAGGAR